MSDPTGTQRPARTYRGPFLWRFNMQTEAEVLTGIPRTERKQKHEAIKLNGVNSHARRQQQRKEKLTSETERARTDTHMFDRRKVQHPDSQNQYRSAGYEQCAQVDTLVILNRWWCSFTALLQS